MNKKYYSDWEEYNDNRFRRWDKETKSWITMQIHSCCLGHTNRHYGQGKTFKKAVSSLKFAKEKGTG